MKKTLNLVEYFFYINGDRHLFIFSRNLFNSLFTSNITLHPFLFAVPGLFLFVLLYCYFSGVLQEIEGK